MKRATGGFTLAEVLVAILILSIGVLAIAASSGSVYRMLGSGRRSTIAANLLTTRMEWLRREANRTTPRCAALANGGGPAAAGYTEAWTVTGTGPTRNITVIIGTPSPAGLRPDTTHTLLDCA